MYCLTRNRLRIVGALLVVGSASLAQESAVKRAIIDRVDVEKGSEAVVATAELAAGASLGLHTHPGIEIGYVTEGELELLVSGSVSQRYKKGESFRIAADTAHGARNPGTVSAKVIAVLLVEKGKPTATPVR